MSENTWSRRRPVQNAGIDAGYDELLRNTECGEELAADDGRFRKGGDDGAVSIADEKAVTVKGKLRGESVENFLGAAGDVCFG